MQPRAAFDSVARLGPQLTRQNTTEARKCGERERGELRKRLSALPMCKLGCLFNVDFQEFFLCSGPGFSVGHVYYKYSSRILCVSIVYSLKIGWVNIPFTQSNTLHFCEVLEQVQVSCDDRNQNLQRGGCDGKGAAKNLLGWWIYSVSQLEWQLQRLTHLSKFTESHF